MNINWKDWDLVISASQVETWDDCRRKWWFSKVGRLPELDKGFQIYGNVIHAVADRFFGADDLGYDRKTKQPVDLYPKGWEISYDRTDKSKILGVVTPQEQAQIKLLVKKAIEEGIWVRMPGREPEASFFRPVAERIAIIGYIDLMTPDAVHDHKSTKNMGYAKSAADLPTNTQLLIYAKECFDRADEQGRKLETVTVRHNTFSKDPKDPTVRAVSNTVTRKQVMDFWAGVVERAKAMRTLKRAGIAAEAWSGVAGPKDKKTCEAYGGCAFRTICGKVETPDKYRARIVKAQQAQHEGASTLTNGKNDMGLFDKMKASGGTPPAATTPAPTPAASPAPKADAAPTAPPKEQLQATGLHPDQVAAPWARETDKSCGGKGLTKQGKPCRVCDTFNKKEGKPTSDAWNLGTDEAGRITWTPKDGSAPAGSTPAVATPTVVDKTTAASAPAQPAAAPAAPASGGALSKKRGRKSAEAPAAPAATTPAEPAAAEPEASNEQGEGEEPTEANGDAKRGRKPQGFTLLINALPERAKTTGVIGLDQVFAERGAELAEAMGAESYFALDAYKRRDWLAMRAPQIAETFGSKIVTAVGNSPDFLEFLTAIKPYASYVYVGASKP